MKGLHFDNVYQEIILPYFQGIKDSRSHNTVYTLADTLAGIFAMFSLKSPSLLNFEQRTKKESSNIPSIFGLTNIPSASQARNILDEVATVTFHGLFPKLINCLNQHGVLKGYRILQGRLVVWVDGSGFFESKKVTCPYCLQKKQADGSISCSHAMVSGVLVHPDQKTVFPLATEPIVQQDGNPKNDCEINAAKRLLKRIAEQYGKLKLLVVEDALYANGPHINQLLEANIDYMINVKPDGNTTLFTQFEGRKKRGEVKVNNIKSKDNEGDHTFYYANNLRLNATHNIRCNMLVYEYTDKQGKVKRFSWITNISLHTRNVEQVMKAGRSRWKIENETFNTLKNQGYKLEHNYGHGKQYLANNFAILMRLAFLVDQIQQACCKLFIAAWIGIGTKVKLWEAMRAVFKLKSISSMRECWLIILAEYDIQIKSG